MRTFLLGAAGALLVLIAAALLIPQYGDFRDRARVGSLLAAVEPLKLQVAEKFPNTPDNPATGITPPAVEGAEVLVQRDGSIVVHDLGPSGALILLQPSLNAGAVNWRCVGGPAKAMPHDCR